MKLKHGSSFSYLCQLLVLVTIFSAYLGCHRSEPSSPDSAEVESARQVLGKSTESLPGEVGDGSPNRATRLNGSIQSQPSSCQPWFIDATESSGLDFYHHAGRTEDRFLPEIMGSGVLVADFDRNGAPDVLLIGGGDPRADGRPETARNRLYLNDGTGKFIDATEQWGLPSPGYGMGGAVGDFDNDGWMDVYLTTYGGQDRLLRNTGSGFVDITLESGIESDSSWSSSALFFDADNDGWLDLLVVRYVEYTQDSAVPTFFNGVHVYATPQFHDGIPDVLYRNLGNGSFARVEGFHALIDAGSGDGENPFKGLAVGSADFNGDGLPDIYIANDIRRNFLLINRGNFEFEEAGQLFGVAYGEAGTAQAGMGVAFAHLDANGIPSIVCSNFQGEPANLFMPMGELLLERSAVVGVAQATRQRLQWGAQFFDANNDGQEELMIANGHIYDNIDLLYTGIGFAQQNTLLQFQAEKFIDISNRAGPALETVQVSRGLAVADFNSDGRLDFLVSNNDDTPLLGLNETQQSGNFLSIWLEGTQSNRSAIGTKIVARIGPRKVIREVFGGTSYLSASDLRVHLGLGEEQQVSELEIRWPSGTVQSFLDVAGNAFYRLEEDQELETYQPGKQIFLPATGPFSILANHRPSILQRFYSSDLSGDESSSGEESSSNADNGVGDSVRHLRRSSSLNLSSTSSSPAW